MEKSIEQPLYKMPGIKVAAIPLLCVNLAYLLFILVIAFHNVPQADDYCFMVTLDYHGFFGSMMWWYQNWQGRFMPYIIINAFLFIYERFGTLLPYALFLIFIYLFSIYSLLIKIISPPRSTWNRLFILGLSITVFNTLLLFHLDTATFFWINVSAMYFGGVAFFLLGTNYVFTENESIFSYSVLIFSFLYAGASSELFGLMVLILLAVMLWIVFYNKGKLIEENRRKMILKKIGISLSAALVAFIIMYLAPGNKIRTSNFPPSSILNAIKLTPSALNYFIFLLIPSRLGYLFIVLFAFIFAGAYFGKKQYKEYISFRIALLCFIILAGAILFTQFIFMYALSYSGPSRAYVHLSMLFVVVAAY